VNLDAPTYSLCYTSVRPQAVGPVIQQWLGRAANPSRVEIIVSFDLGNDLVRDAALAVKADLPSYLGYTVVANTGPKNCVSGWNTCARQAVGDVIIAISDDFSALSRWDVALRDAGPVGWWNNEHVVWIKDGYNTDLFTLTILTRKRYERFGYLFYPQYRSLFGDTELTYVAKQDHVVIDARHLLFEHLHPDCGKRERDTADLLHASAARWQFGETLFNYRLLAGFPLDDGPNFERWSAAPVRYAVVVQAIKDDFCLYDVCQRILEEGIRLWQTTEQEDRIERIYLFCPDTRWDGQPADIIGREEVEDISVRLERWLTKHVNTAVTNPHVEYVPFRVKDVANVNQSRIMVETDCRNWYQRYCLSNGYEHCIIMDGDELWRPGLLARMNEMVRERWPMSIYTGMIPVAGLPGYPIEGAKDKATIYCRADNTFESCRSAYGYKHDLDGFDIYHFSATRKTIEEIAGKHLNSGHADQKEYEMEAWVQDTLMNGRIRPGARDMHMFRVPNSQNIWPLVRKWTPLELEQELPKSILPYLGKV
jgi:hypothetical protein